MHSDDLDGLYVGCFCGSGMPYGECHRPQQWTLPASHPDTRARLHDLHAAADRLNARLARLAAALFGKRWLQRAIEDLFDEDIDDIDPAEHALAVPATFYWSFIVAEDKSIVQLWEENNVGRRLRTEEHDYLRAFERAEASIWNVRRIEPGLGLGLVDAFTGQEAFVHDAPASSSLRLHQSILAIVLDCNGLCLFGGQHPLVLDSPASDAAIDRAKSLIQSSRRRGRRRRMAELDWIEAEQKRRHIIASWKKQRGS